MSGIHQQPGVGGQPDPEVFVRGIMSTPSITVSITPSFK